MIERVFVYGTLKPELRNYHVAQKAGLEHFEEAYVEGFSVYDVQPEDYPALVPGPGRVHGYVLSFADIEVALTHLDELESVYIKPPLYSRRSTHILPLGIEAWIYVYEQTLARPGVRLEPSGVWQPFSHKSSSTTA